VRPTVAEPARPRADDDELAEFAAALEELVRAVLRVSGRGVPGGETELTLSQYFLMDAMGDGTLTVSEVARAARVAVPTATRALRALEERGFVQREREDGEDRRLVTVALTRSGRGVLEEKHEWVRTRQREIFEGLSQGERESVAETLNVLAEGIAEM
jgi:DNA-binding MarR family transcriptional regulator